MLANFDKLAVVKPGSAEQVVDFRSGNEVAAISGAQIDYEVMGYYPITPSTEIAEYLDEMGANGQHSVKMIPADGEHGAAGICYGATTAGGRVMNATSAQGVLYSMEQLPVQSGTRFPMVLNVVCRSVSGPLDIRGDHSDIMAALNCGWIILCAKDPQEVYDMNILAVKIGELADVRLPVMVASDGFFSSHQKRRVHLFKNKEDIQNFIGEFQEGLTLVHPDKPVTIGPYMNDPDMINNKKQLIDAMEAAYEQIQGVFDEYAELTGRQYNILETYKMEDAESAVVLMNSAADTGFDAVDKLRASGKKCGLVYHRVIRPFPHKEMQKVFKNVKAVVVADRADSYGAHNGNMSMEIKAALKDDPNNKTLVISRIYGLGGKDFYAEDCEEMFRLAQEAADSGVVKNPYDYIGIEPGDVSFQLAPAEEQCALTLEETTPKILNVTYDEENKEVKVKGVKQRDLTAMPQRIVPGHGACPGCGIFPSVGTFLKGIEGFVVMLWHTGCGMVVTTGYPNTSFKISYLHNLFQNGAATLSGVVEMYKERQRRGQIPKDEEITFVMVTGDGGLDIGLGPALGTAFRNHNMIILEYDNEGYMNTGNQLSFTTPLGHATSTSAVGSVHKGKTFHHKDSPQLFAACHIPYVFTAVETDYKDLIKKAAKAQWYARNKGLVFGKVFSDCPLNWRHPDHTGQDVVMKAVNCNFFPLYEVEQGKTRLNYDPEAKGKKVHVSEWLNSMGKTKHLLKPENKHILDEFERETERRFARIKAMSESPLL